MVVEHRRKQVVGGADCMEVTRKVQVDILHRDDLGITAAGSTALDAEDRSEGRLAECGAYVLAEPGKTVSKADRRRGLAFTGRGRRDSGHEDQLALFRLCFGFKLLDIDLCLVVAVELQAVLGDPGGLCHLGDLLHLICLSDLNVG